jgi:ABC-2 type transport system permease protein
VLFTQLFSRIASFPGLFPPGVSYLAFATPGILLQNAFSSALQSGNSMVDDLNSGYLQKMLVTPVSRSAILLGRLAADAFRVTIQSVIIVVLGYALGFTVATGVLGVIGLILIIAFFGLAWSGISLAIGLRTKSSETVFGIGGFLTFPLLFMSNALFPTSGMPGWMATVSSLNPISYAVSAVRSFTLPSSAFSVLGLSLPGSPVYAAAYILAIAVVTMGATLYMFRKVVS